MTVLFGNQLRARTAALAALVCLLCAQVVAAQKGARPAKAKDHALTFEMRSMPWATAFEWLSDKTGLPVISAQKQPKGSLNIISPKKKYTLAQVMDIFNESLMDQKLVLIRGPKSFTLVPAEKSKIRPGLVPRVRLSDLEGRGRTEIVSVILRLRQVPAEEFKDDITKLQGPFGNLIVLTRANQLIVQDTVDNIENILRAVEDIRESQKGVAESQFEVIKLKKANATNVARVLNEVYNGTPANGLPFGPPGPGGAPVAPAPSGKDEPRIRVVADPDTNSIMVKAAPLDMAAIKKLVKKSLDVSNEGSEALLRPHVIGPLKYVNATDVSAVLKDVFRESVNNNPTADQQPRRPVIIGDPAPVLGIDPEGKKGVSLSVAVDERTNSLIVFCPDRTYKDIKKLVDMLEKAASKSRPTVKMVSIKGVDPKIIQHALDAIQGRSTSNGNGQSRQTMIVPVPFPNAGGGGLGGLGPVQRVGPRGRGGR
jgi:type II secretory pathway component GspD/PulD (secretin)